MNLLNKLILSFLVPFLFVCSAGNNSQTKFNKTKGKAVPWNQWEAEEDRIFSDFMDAIFRNDYSFVNKCIQNGLSCDFTTECGLSPIELAVLAGHEKIVALLMKNGGRIDPSKVALAGVLHQSIPILEQSGFKSGQTSNPLAYALGRGANDEVIKYLLDNYIKNKHTLQQDVECFNSLLSVSSDNFYPEPGRKVAIAKMLLSSGVVACSSSYACNFDYIIQFADLTEDTLLLKKLWYDVQMVIKRRQNYRNELLGKKRSLKSFDSLLNSGANPFEILFTYNKYHQETSHECVFDNLKTYGSFALDWQKVKLCVKLNPDLARQKMNGRDTLFIATVSADMPFIQRMASTEKGIDSLVGAVNRNGANALTLAASAGDTAMTAFLLGLPFSENDRETALLNAVKSRSVNGVRILIEHGVNPHLPNIHKKEGLQSLFMEMFAYQYLLNATDTTPGIDTSIAEILLSAASNYNSSSLITEETRSVLSIRSFLIYRSNNPELFRFLWRQQPWFIDKAEFFSNPGVFARSDLLYDTTIMNVIDYHGYEDSIIKAILNDYGTIEDYDKKHTAANFSCVIDNLNKVIASGVALDKNLPRDWTGRPGESEGKYQIGFDFTQRKFIPVWNVPSLFSSRAAFIFWEDGE